MRKYTNTSSIPLSVAVFLATDKYDHDSDTISATALLKPLRQIVLGARVPMEDALIDVSNLVSSRMGTAIHDGIERAWLNHYRDALSYLGYPSRVIDRVRINPNPDDVGPDCIPIFLEQRSYRQVDGKTVSGKFDFVAEGRIEDFKTTSVNTWIFNSKDDDFIMQGSIYRWLNPKIVTQDQMAIQFIFTDWSAMQARNGTNYPPKRVMERVLKLHSVEYTDGFIRNKLAQIDHYWNVPEPELPLCTAEELWRKPPHYKYYKNPQKMTRSTKNFESKQDAYIRLAQDGNVGLVVETQGQVVACKYCPAFQVCTQKDGYIASGELQL